MIRLISNILWFLFGGLLLALLWGIVGLLLCITIIGIPFGVQCFKFARLSLFPYGARVKLDITSHPIANVIWAIVGGWEIALIYLVFCHLYHLYFFEFYCIIAHGPEGHSPDPMKDNMNHLHDNLQDFILTSPLVGLFLHPTPRPI